MPRPTELSIAEARRIALFAQGLAGPRPARAGDSALAKMFARVQLVQIDSVNVLCRSQELPLWARLGSHDRRLLPAAIERRSVFEYWAHAACLAPVELQPLLRWRMAEAFQNGAWGSLVALGKRKPKYVKAVLDEIRARGPLAASEMSDAAEKRRPGQWWSWGDHKRALELLFWAGELSTSRRTAQFERVYDLTERVLPASVLALPTPAVEDAQRGLLERGARALGVGTAADIADYFRIRTTARARIAELVEAGTLLPVVVEGWKHPAYLHREATSPRSTAAAALLSPFDSLVWERKRTERLFDFHYRIEI
ncbi:MAG TPA: crosslink repair DNA glycosylase YcaQ family protein, partial [Polyangiaceae bacterium]